MRLDAHNCLNSNCIFCCAPRAVHAAAAELLAAEAKGGRDGVLSWSLWGVKLAPNVTFAAKRPLDRVEGACFVCRRAFLRLEVWSWSLSSAARGCSH